MREVLERFPWLRYGWAAMAILAGVLTLGAMVAQISRYVEHRRLNQMIERCSADRAGHASAGNKKDASPSPVVERIMKRNVFSPPAPPGEAQFAGPRLIGVLGQDALFDGNQSVKVGGMIGGARLTKIGADSVEIDFNGKPATLMVFTPGAGASAGGSPSGPPGMGVTGRGMMPPNAAPSSMAPPGAAASAGMTVTPEMIESFKKLPPEARQKALERMPAEMREKLGS